MDKQHRTQKPNSEAFFSGIENEALQTGTSVYFTFDRNLEQAVFNKKDQFRLDLTFTEALMVRLPGLPEYCIN